MISFVSIQEILVLVSDDRLNLPVNLRQRVVILGASRVDVFEVDAHAPASVALLDQNRIGYPGRILYWSDDTGFDLFFHLFFDRLTAIRR